MGVFLPNIPVGGAQSYYYSKPPLNKPETISAPKVWIATGAETRDSLWQLQNQATK